MLRYRYIDNLRTDGMQLKLDNVLAKKVEVSRLVERHCGGCGRNTLQVPILVKLDLDQPVLNEGGNLPFLSICTARTGDSRGSTPIRVCGIVNAGTPEIATETCMACAHFKMVNPLPGEEHVCVEKPQAASTTPVEVAIDPRW